MTTPVTLPADYWQTLDITPKDIEYLQTYLFERETPLTPRELAGVLIAERLRAERETAEKKQGSLKPYLPKETYAPGDSLSFPALKGRGRVASVRAGINPELENFDVIAVDMEDGNQRQFAARLVTHPLNDAPLAPVIASGLDPEAVARDFGVDLARKLDTAFAADESLVRIAGRWFPRSLLLDINTGHLNLAEALLDMAAGQPLPTEALIKDLELPAGVNPKLVEFSLNYALQEDARFDEVGPAGQVLWCLERLEPEGVRTIPPALQYIEIPHDRAALTAPMLQFEAQMDDELSPISAAPVEELIIHLLYPHWRSGTLPMSARARELFPTAYESPRVCFTLIDAKTGKSIPAWVVRKHGYVYGLTDWFKASESMPGGAIRITRGARPGEVRIEALTRRPVRDWVRTVLVGADGGIVFALLKQQIGVEVNDRAGLAVPDPAGVDAAREQIARANVKFETLVKNVMRELVKLSPQGHVHIHELYAAVNILRRVPPAPLLALLASDPAFTHVGDMHFRMDD